MRAELTSSAGLVTSSSSGCPGRSYLGYLSQKGCTDVWVVDLGVENDLGRGHGVVVRKEQLCLELAVFVAGPGRA